MILSFRVKNFRSIANEAILSFRPVKAYKEYPENIHRYGNIEALKAAGIYGANASGKSNLVKAFGAMRNILLGSLRRSSIDEIDVEPFELDSANLKEPSEFDVEMLAGGYVYRYGFSVTAKSVAAEWLFRSSGEPRAVSKPLFVREGSTLLKANKRVLRELQKLDMTTLLPNALLLSRLDQLNSNVAKLVMRWFNELQVLSGSLSSEYNRYSVMHLNEKAFHDNMMRLIRLADRSILDVSVNTREIHVDDLPPRVRIKIPVGAKIQSIEERTVVMLRRNVDGENVAFDIDEKESEGTTKIFGLSGPLTDILNRGWVLVIDELEAKLHPLLTRRIVSLFMSEKTNPNRAQLIFVTHDATLLRSVGLRRDQVWLCEKNKKGMTDLYCLAEIRSKSGTRKEDNLEKKYLEGRFGAVPDFEDKGLDAFSGGAINEFETNQED